MKRLALLISGGGTTMEQIILSCWIGNLKGLIEPALVIASKGGIKGQYRAIDCGIPDERIVVCNRKDYQSDEQFGEALIELFLKHKIDLVGQFGWLQKTPPNVISQFRNRIINQHPGPLDPGRPDFGGKGMYGIRVHCARLYFARLSGQQSDQFTEATTHYVTKEYDQGAVIGRIEVPILSDDTPYTLAQRVLPVEHKLQIDTLEKMAKGEQTVLSRPTPLVSEQQVPLLDQAKNTAAILFPKG